MSSLHSSEKLDLITIGRASVDLYGTQVGGRLEDMTSFEKYIGGSPTNIAAGTARLGLKSALITRVGDEHMGRFIREQLTREGVDTSAVITDHERLTALVLLGIRDEEQFPLIFYRENCADMAICEDDIDEEFISKARALCATGTHLSNPQVEGATLKALNIARKNGLKTALDIDYRPNLWGLAGHDAGESRFIESKNVTKKLQSTLPLFDLIVGTEEEFHIAGGTTDTIRALQNVRALTQAVLVCKRGPLGAVAFEQSITSWEDGISGQGFPIEVFNVLGAGDGFMSGLLKGWLDGGSWNTALTYANACGAFAVSRHGCAPSYPSWDELQFFLNRGIKNKALRHDEALEQIHWSTNRRVDWPDLRIFAFDHRSQFEEMPHATPEKISHFKQLCLKSVIQVADGRKGYGILCDSRFGQNALFQAIGQDLWIARPAELPGSYPLKYETELGADLGAIREWPMEHIVKCLCFYHIYDDEPVRQQQEEMIMRLFQAARRNRLEFLLEVIPSRYGLVDDETTSQIIERIYALGIYPDWWKLEPMQSAKAWSMTVDIIKKYDPFIQGIVVLGQGVSEDELKDCFQFAASEPLVKGFAVGRTIFQDTAENWLQGRISDDKAIEQLSQNYQSLCSIWDRARMDNANMHKAEEDHT